MTAEIVIMNKEAIALAADSAVTMSFGETGEKVFTSANKLFALSKYQPVGIMVYGSANFMDVPWETIIKVYRNSLGRKKFNTLKEYANHFIGFLDNGNPLFPDSVQEDQLRSSIYSYFDLIANEIRERVSTKMQDEGGITDEAIERIISAVIKEHYESWKKTDNIPSIPKSFNKNIIDRYREVIDEVTKEVFEELPISKRGSNQLREIAASLFSKFPEGIGREGISGVVITGFGAEEAFPSLDSFDIEGILDNKLKYEEHVSRKISFETIATIIPFAQGEMVATFMEGIDPGLESQIDGHLSEIFDHYPEIIADSIEKFDDNEKQLLKARLKEVSSEIFEDYQKEVQAYRRKNYVEPVTRVVTMLPKDELAAMAETLVNLTLFKQKVTLGTETVAGPIDVAVISKGDGFIWIKRKYYFNAELNPQFFASYYEEK